MKSEGKLENSNERAGGERMPSKKMARRLKGCIKSES